MEASANTEVPSHHRELKYGNQSFPPPFHKSLSVLVRDVSGAASGAAALVCVAEGFAEARSEAVLRALVV